MGKTLFEKIWDSHVVRELPEDVLCLELLAVDSDDLVVYTELLERRRLRKDVLHDK